MDKWSSGRDDEIDLSCQNILDLFTKNGAGFKMAQNTFIIKWRSLPVAFRSFSQINQRPLTPQ